MNQQTENEFLYNSIGIPLKIPIKDSKDRKRHSKTILLVSQV